MYEHIPSTSFNDRRFPYLIIHGIGTSPEYNKDFLAGKGDYEGSAHYYIEGNGNIIRFVEEEKRAWHAGIGYWSGLTDINSISIGIEIQANPIIKHESEFHLVGYNRKQMDVLADLAKDIMERHKILPAHILGHQDISPYRKYDPGPHFDWSYMAEKGIGLWHDLEPVKDDLVIADEEVIEKFKTNLALYGYDPRPNAEGKKFSWLVRAFQTHFLPWNISGDVTEQSVQALDIVLAKKLSV